MMIGRYVHRKFRIGLPWAQAYTLVWRRSTMDQNYSFQLLAPCSGFNFGRPEVNRELYQKKLADVQKLRGDVYRDSGALRSEQVDSNGRFRMHGDEESWHLLLVDDTETVVGCTKYRVHPKTAAPEQLRILNWSSQGPDLLQMARRAVENDFEKAREGKLSYVEVGGWALKTAWRGTKAALETLAACYALGALWGGSVLLGMATVQNGVLSVLRRIGGAALELNGQSLAAFSDPRYQRHVELLRFDSRSPAPQFVPVIHRMKDKLSASVVFQTGSSQRETYNRALGASTA